MKTAVVTGACGLVGAEAVSLLCEEGFRVIGIDNDMRSYFFGEDASTKERGEELEQKYDSFHLLSGNIVNTSEVRSLFEAIADISELELVVHTAAQPSHDWAAKEPFTDFAVNAVGTLNLLEATRRVGTHVTFAHISTSKVYGDNPNRLDLQVHRKRFDPPRSHRFHEGIDTTMRVDGKRCLHSLFGVSKLSGDLLVQEYGRYFKMPTVCFRPGCVTGPGHAGAELHGFLSYLMKCALTGKPYTVFGYDMKQVRCNIYGRDLAAACLAFHRKPQSGAVYNIGGGRMNAVSMMEAIELCERLAGTSMDVTYEEEPRIGDHMWWISSNKAFEEDYPDWEQTRSVEEMLLEIAEAL
jgi:CDP-paratose 2-epimerase